MGAASEKKIFIPWEKFVKKDKIDKIFLSIFLMKLLITAFFLRILPSLPSKASTLSKNKNVSTAKGNSVF
jgi:hypothetical protein